MKRQIQLRGERDWAGEDLIDLQKEPLKVLDSFFAAYKPCIINGCKIVESGSLFNVTSGYVSIKGNDTDGNITSMVVPFAGVTSVSLPIYLTLKCDIVNDVYGDGATKPIAYNYYAGYSAVVPSGEYLEISKSVKCKFEDVIQLSGSGHFMTLLERLKLAGIESNANKYIHPNDSNTQHVTDAEKETWNKKASNSTASTSANGLMSTSDKSKLDGIAAGANKYVHPADSNSRHITDAEKTKLGRVDMIIGRCAYTDDMFETLNISKHRGEFSIAEINRPPSSPFVGSYRITHNLGHTDYLVDLYYDSFKNAGICAAPYQARYSNYVDVSFNAVDGSGPTSFPMRTEFSFKITVF